MYVYVQNVYDLKWMYVQYILRNIMQVSKCMDVQYI